MNRTEIIRIVCEMTRSRYNSAELIEKTAERLLSEVDPERRDAMRYEIDNAIAAIKRELGKDRDIGSMLQSMPKERS
jgi:hypothetical protein